MTSGKPFRRVALIPLTQEDWDIWARCIVGNLRLPTCLWSFSIQSDRRDAELMHWAAVCRNGPWCMTESGIAHAGWRGALFYKGELPLGGSNYMK
jgi:hypothetical protein